LPLLSFDIPYQLDVAIHRSSIPRFTAFQMPKPTGLRLRKFQFSHRVFGFHVISTKRQAIALAANDPKLNDMLARHFEVA
jgi:hypothetical protein